MKKISRKKQIYDIWTQHEPYIRKLCSYKLKSLPDYIDDCIQDVFLDLSDALDKGKTIEYPKAWLTKVANNKIKDIYTQAKKDAERLVYIDSQNFDNTYCGVVYDEYFQIEDEQLLLLKEKVVNMLDDKEQQLLYDRYTLKKSIPAIASEQKTTENNIYQKLFRLKQKTKMLIEKVLNE